METLSSQWRNYIDELEIAFQPIVTIESGEIFGVEALLRGTEKIGFDSIAHFFDTAFEANVLYGVELALRYKVMERFVRLENFRDLTLFINVDNRLFEMSDFSAGNTAKFLHHFGLHSRQICFEISERTQVTVSEGFEELMRHYKEEHYRIAIDDFGMGYSGFLLLYRSTPHILKIDRFFLSNICTDIKKRTIVQSIVDLAQRLDIVVLAEGVESATELMICRQMGCQLVQGYYVQRPTTQYETLDSYYPQVAPPTLTLCVG